MMIIIIALLLAVTMVASLLLLEVAWIIASELSELNSRTLHILEQYVAVNSTRTPWREQK